MNRIRLLPIRITWNTVTSLLKKHWLAFKCIDYLPISFPQNAFIEHSNLKSPDNIESHSPSSYPNTWKHIDKPAEKALISIQTHWLPSNINSSRCINEHSILKSPNSIESDSPSSYPNTLKHIDKPVEKALISIQTHWLPSNINSSRCINEHSILKSPDNIE